MMFAVTSYQHTGTTLYVYTVCPNKSDNTKLLALVSANLHRIAHN